MPRPRGIVKKVIKARAKVQDRIASEVDHSSIYSRGMANEGYQGGYMQALDDVLLALNGVHPRTNGYWDEEPPKSNP